MNLEELKALLAEVQAASDAGTLDIASADGFRERADAIIDEPLNVELAIRDLLLTASDFGRPASIKKNNAKNR